MLSFSGTIGFEKFTVSEVAATEVKYIIIVIPLKIFNCTWPNNQAMIDIMAYYQLKLCK